jgi:hypothetical protein
VEALMMQAVRADYIDDVAITPDRAWVRVSCRQGEVASFLFEFPSQQMEKLTEGMANLILGLFQKEGRFVSRDVISLGGEPGEGCFHVLFELRQSGPVSLAIPHSQATILHELLGKYLAESGPPKLPN